MDIDIVLEASAIKDHRCGKAGDSSRQNHDIKEQETGKGLGSQVAADRVDRQLRQGAKGSFILRLWIRRGGTKFRSTPSLGFHQRAPISAYKFKAPRVS